MIKILSNRALYGVITLTPLFSFSFSVAYAQCNTTFKDRGDFIEAMSGKEELYANEDLENGLHRVYGSTTLIKDKNSDNMDHWIYVIVAADDYNKIIIPRKLRIYFKNGEQILLDASQMLDETMSGRTKIVGCGFELDLDESTKLINQSISKIKLTDHRKSKSFDFRPYPELFKEQVQCVKLGR